VKTAVNILVAAAVLATVNPARADLVSQPTCPTAGLVNREVVRWLTVSPVTGGLVRQSADSSAAGRGASWLQECLGEACDSVPAASAGSGDERTEAAPGTDVWQLPSSPSSSSLFLSALLSAGAFHLSRKARNVHLGHLPAWYHEACPDRIGHAVAFDFDLTVMPLCSFASVLGVENERPACFDTLRERASRRQSQHFLPVTAPRAPPSRS
jgi:hypothetical protein